MREIAVRESGRHLVAFAARTAAPAAS